MPQFSTACTCAASLGLAGRLGRYADADDGGAGGGLTGTAGCAEGLAGQQVGELAKGAGLPELVDHTSE